MLHLITGTSGSGKTTEIRKIIKEKALAGQKNIMLIIPEQFSFTTETHMLTQIGAKLSNEIKVYSFSRLCEMVFRKTGNIAGDRLDESGRLMLMSEAIDSTKTQTKILENVSIDQDIIKMFSDLNKELKHSNITDDELYKASDEIKDVNLKQKVKQIALINEAYDSLVARGYLDSIDDLTKLDEVLYTYDYFKNYTIFIDCFDGFTVQELNIISHILRQSLDVYMNFTIDKIYDINDKYDLFYPVRKNVKDVLKIAKDNDIEVIVEKKMTNNPRFQNDELKYLEKNIYRALRKKNKDTISNINIYEADNIYDECNFVAKNIKRLLYEENYRLKDIAVVSRNISQYNGIINSAFEKYELNYFFDIKDRIDERPLMNLVTNAFEIIHSKYSTYNVLSLLKTGLINISVEELAELENYVLMWKIDKSMWKQEFTFNPSGLKENFSKSDISKLMNINNSRKKIIEPLEKLERQFESEKALNIANALYQFMIDVNTKECIIKLSNKLKSDNQFDLAAEQIRLWEVLINILDQIVAIMDNKKTSSKRFYNLLQLAINSKDMAFIPRKSDEILIGSVGRTVLDEPKIVFVLGANEGEFPKTPQNNSILTNKDRKKLKDISVDLHTSLEYEAAKEKYLVYKTLTLASEKIFLSYNEATVNGESKIESSAIREIINIFPNLKINNSNSFDVLDDVRSIKSGFEALSKSFLNNDSNSKSLYDVYLKNKEYKDKINALKTACKKQDINFDDSEIARKLFGETMRISASQLEQYYTCSFKYFCRYGIRAKERKVAELNALEYGSLIHYAFEKIIKKQTIPQLNSMEFLKKRGLIYKYFKEYIEARFGQLENQPSRFKYLFTRTVNTATNLLSHIVDELSQSEFKPYATELDIGIDIEPLTLHDNNGDTIQVIGKVDRVDVMQKGSTKYVRVIDYKTGEKKFKLSDILYGLNMQMLIYLDTISKSEDFKNSVPSGILYMPATNSAVTVSHNDEKIKLESERNKKLMMNGLILNDISVIRGMEKDTMGVYIPAKSDGEKIKKSDSLASLEQFGKISKKVESLIIEMSQELKQGNISTKPTHHSDEEHTACDWCPYSDVCGHEEDDDFVEIDKMNNAEALQLIEREDEDVKELD